MKSFHISAVTPTIVIAMLGLITILILGIVIIILKPVNFEASILSFFILFSNFSNFYQCDFDNIGLAELCN